MYLVTSNSNFLQAIDLVLFKEEINIPHFKDLHCPSKIGRGSVALQSRLPQRIYLENLPCIL